MYSFQKQVNSFVTLLRYHWLAIIGAVGLGLFVAIPLIVFFSRQEMNNFDGIWPVLNGDSLYYQSRIQEVIDGHREINHPYFFEHKTETYPQATGGEWLMASMSQTLGVKLPKFLAIFAIFFAIILYLETYSILYIISSRKFLSLSLPIIFYILVFGFGSFYKPIHPAVSTPLLLLFFIFFLQLTINNGRRWIHIIGAGVTWGLLFLIYFYHWAFITVFIGIFAMIKFIKKDWKKVKDCLFILLIALIVGIPYFLSVAKGVNAPHNFETAIRVGVYRSHWPETLPKMTIAIVWLLFFLIFTRRLQKFSDPKAQYIVSLLAANIIFPNHQIFTGIIIQNSNHWTWLPIFIYMLSYTYCVSVIKESSIKKISYKIIICIGSILFILPLMRMASFFWSSETISHLNTQVPLETHQQYGTLFQWIEDTIPKDTVFFASRNLMEYIPAYTHSNVYYTSYAFNLPGSDTEVIERALLSHFFDGNYFKNSDFGLSEDNRIIWVQPSQSERNSHTLHRVMGWSYPVQYGVETELAKVETVYKNLQKTGWNVALLKRYKIDYIIWDKTVNPEWHLEKYNELKKITDVDIFSIWSFKN